MIGVCATTAIEASNRCLQLGIHPTTVIQYSNIGLHSDNSSPPVHDLAYHKDSKTRVQCFTCQNSTFPLELHHRNDPMEKENLLRQNESDRLPSPKQIQNQSQYSSIHITHAFECQRQLIWLQILPTQRVTRRQDWKHNTCNKCAVTQTHLVRASDSRHSTLLSPPSSNTSIQFATCLSI